MLRSFRSIQRRNIVKWGGFAPVPGRWSSAAAGGGSRSGKLEPLTEDGIPLTFDPAKSTRRRGLGIVHDPNVNKGTGFSFSERERLRIRGLVPPRMLDIDTQASKIYNVYSGWRTPLNKHVYLTSLQDRNETLFYKVLIQHIEEMAPIIYTPTVGQACEQFGDNFRRSRGMYFSSQDAGEMSSMVYNWPHDDVEVVVVTDGSRILGLGDLGANGMGIPIGKLSLYVAAGGIDPTKTLPVLLDCGTNNKKLLANPYYLGMQHERLDGHAYYQLVHELLEAIYHRWPRALVQFEDFSTNHAAHILERYRHHRLCFNDDIQGTGAVTLAGVLCAIRNQGKDPKLADQRIVVVGAGSAGIGVASSLREGMLHEGLSDEEAGQRFWVVDDKGLLTADRDLSRLSPEQMAFVRQDCTTIPALVDVVRQVKPTILLGLTGVPGIFTEDVIREMAAHVDRPIIFPLSNPTSSAECTAEQAYTWTDGRAVVASGSPFGPVTVNGKTLQASQGNNMFIFPAMGLGALLAGARVITDSMFYEAAKALAMCVSEQDLESGMVFPKVRNIRDVSAKVAVAVWKTAAFEGIATNQFPANEPLQHVQDAMWKPKYAPIINHVY